MVGDLGDMQQTLKIIFQLNENAKVGHLRYAALDHLSRHILFRDRP